MTISVTHKFVSAKADSPDPTLINPSNWNASHNVTDTSNVITSCDYAFTPQAPGGSLIVGSNPITFNPLPPGLAIGGYLYISGGVGVAEAVPITGISGSVISVTCANTHSGSWNIQSATGGLQEAVAVAPSVGSRILLTCNITLYANVYSLGKFVPIIKFSGVSITNINTFSIYNNLGPQAGVTNEEQMISPGVTSFFGQNDSYTQPSYLPYTTAVNIFRSVSSATLTASSQAAQTLWAQMTSTAASGTAGSIRGQADVYNTTSGQGQTGVAGYCVMHPTSATEGIGTHGQCDTYNTNSPAVGVNAEGSLLTAGGGSLFGLVSNIGTSNVGNPNMIGVEVICNKNPNGTNPSGGGVNIHAVTGGTHSYGVHIYDDGGSFINPLKVTTTQSPATAIWVDDSSPGTGAAPSGINFIRGVPAVNTLARIEATHNAGDFTTGQLKFYTSSSLILALTIDQTQKVMAAKALGITPTTFANLPAAATSVGCFATITDSSVNTWGSPAAGGGTNTVGVFSNGGAWTVCSK